MRKPDKEWLESYTAPDGGTMYEIDGQRYVITVTLMPEVCCE